MPTVVILSGRGKCGLAIARQFVADGWDVVATASGPVSRGDFPAAVTWRHLDRSDGPDLTGVVDDGTDLVVDTMCMIRRDALALAALGDRVGSAVVLSTVSVYSDEHGFSLDEAKGPDTFPQWPNPLLESQVTLAPSDATYSTSKVAMEMALRETAPFPVTILRCGAIHGPLGRDLREWYFIKRVLDGRTRVILPYRGQSVFGSLATVNVAAMVRDAAHTPGNRTLNCGDENPPSVSEIASVIGEIMDHDFEQIVLEGPPPREGLGDHPWMVPRPVVPDTSLAQREIGYQPVATYAAAMADTVQWACAATRAANWESVFSSYARYYATSFNYESEDAYFS